MDDILAGSQTSRMHAARRYAQLDIARSLERSERNSPPPVVSPAPANATDVLLDLDFARLFGYLGKRKLWIIAAVILGAVAGLAFGILGPARFTAQTEVLIDPTSLQVVSNDVYTSSDQRDAMVLNVESKMRVLTSGQVFGRVIGELHLTDDPEFTAYATLSSLDSAIKVLQDRVKTARDEKSFVVTVSATTNNAAKSVKLAGAVVAAFKQDLADSEAQGASRAADALTERLASLKGEVTKAETAVEDYKRAHHLQTSQGELTSTQTMTQVNTQLVQVRAKLVDLQSRYDKLSSGSPDSLTSAAAQESSTISALRSQYAATREQAEALKATLGPKHPNVLSINAQVATLQAQISAETARIVQAAKSDVEQAQAAVDQLQSQVDASKTVVDTDNSAQVALRDLEREASSRAAIYEASLDRAKQITEREQIDTTNIRIISEPTIPLTRSFPPPTVQLAAFGAAAGLALSALAALAVGLMRDRRPKPSSTLAVV
jgi:succinoglycan biosynthesis transport protein ExoP